MAKFTSADIEIGVKNKTQQGIKSAEKGIGGLTKLVKGYFAELTVAALAIRKIVKVSKDLLDAYNNQLTAETKLISTLKSTGRWTQELQNEMFAFAGEMQRTTGIADELVIAAEGIMATFTMINTDTFPEAIGLAADMSTLFGQDLQQSIVQLGTALNDPITGVGRLRRIGISFSETQKESIEQFVEQNDLMAAQRVILDELQLELGGVAVALGQTTAGQAKILKQEFGDLKEEMGGLIDTQMPLMIEVASGLKSMLAGLLDLVDKNKRAIDDWKKSLAGFTEDQLENFKTGLEATDKTLMQHWNYLLAEEKRLQGVIDNTKIFSKAHRQAKDELKAVLAEQDKVNDSLEKNGIKLAEVNEQLDALHKNQVIARKDNEDEKEILPEIAKIHGLFTFELIAEEQARRRAIATQEEWNAMTAAALVIANDYYGSFDNTYTPAVNRFEEQIEELKLDLESVKDLTVDALTPAFQQFGADMADVIKGSKSMGAALKDLAKNAFGGLLIAIGNQLMAQAALYAVLWQFGKAAVAFAGGVAAIAAGNLIKNMQQGGLVGGYGGGDRVPIMAEPGEMVMRKEIVAQNRPALEAMNAGEGGAVIHNHIYLDGDQILEFISRATESGRLPIHQNAVGSW